MKRNIIGAVVIYAICFSISFFSEFIMVGREDAITKGFAGGTFLFGGLCFIAGVFQLAKFLKNKINK
jgi:hypothetical protein